MKVRNIRRLLYSSLTQWPEFQNFVQKLITSFRLMLLSKERQIIKNTGGDYSILNLTYVVGLNVISRQLALIEEIWLAYAT